VIFPSADRLEDKVGNKYSLVIVTAKRARQLKEGAMPLTESNSQNPLTIAMDEVRDEKVIALEPPEVQEREAALAGAYAQDDASAAAVLLASLGGDDLESDEEDIDLLGLADEEEEDAGEETPALSLAAVEDEETEAEDEEEPEEEAEEE